VYGHAARRSGVLTVTLICLVAPASWAQSDPGPSGAAVTVAHADGRTLAFPGAEGYGKYTRGGRGGAVHEVTNLKDAGPGSLRAAVGTPGPRTVVFRVSGTIDLDSPLTIKNPYITIAGQTAPGDGVAIKDYPIVIAADEVIIRYVRVRLGDQTDSDVDAILARYVKNIILDEVHARGNRGPRPHTRSRRRPASRSRSSPVPRKIPRTGTVPTTAR
jgi:pectate lyase